MFDVMNFTLNLKMFDLNTYEVISLHIKIIIPRKKLNQSTKTAGPVKGALEWCWSAALSRLGLLLDLPLALWITTYYL